MKFAVAFLMSMLGGCRIQNSAPRTMPSVLIEDEVENITLHYVTQDDLTKANMAVFGDLRPMGMTFDKTEDGKIYRWVTASHWQCPDGYKVRWSNKEWDSAYCAIDTSKKPRI